MSNLKEVLTNMLGRHAYKNHNYFTIDPEFSKLVKAVNYLDTQIGMLKHNCDESGKSQIQEVRNNLIDILQSEKNPNL